MTHFPNQITIPVNAGRVICLSLLLGLCAPAFTGCAYFRLGEKSTEDLKRANEEQRDINNRFFKPGTIFYAR